MAGKELSQDLKPLSHFEVKLFSLHLTASFEAELHLAFCFVFLYLLLGSFKLLIHNKYQNYKEVK